MKIKKTIAVFAAIILTCLCFNACAFLPSVVFKQSIVNLRIGEQRSLTDIVSGTTFIAVVEDDSVAEIRDNALVALKEGETKLTVTQGIAKGSAKIIVRQPSSYKLIATPENTSSSVRQTYEFYVEADGSSVRAKWFVNGLFFNEDKRFEFTPSKHGVYKITAKIGDKEFETQVNYYKSFTSVTPQIVGEDAELREPYSECMYSIDGDSVKEIPVSDRMIEWYVNGKVVSSQSMTFGFVPEGAGKYEIYATVNGTATAKKTVTAYGKPQLTGGTYDFDSDYPNVYVSWQSSADVNYSVIIGDKTYDTNNESDRFDGKRFNVKGLINLSNGGEVKIVSQSSEFYSESEPLCINVRPFSKAELEYLEKSYANGNYYMSDVNEFFDFVSYVIAFRPNPVEREYKGQLYPSSTATVYMGYTESEAQTPSELVKEAFKRCNQTGTNASMVTGDSGLSEGSTITFTFTFITVNEPDFIDVSGKDRYEQLIMTSFEGGYSENALNDGKGVDVDTGEELYWAAERGLRPILKEGSAAQRLYQKAKDAVGECVSPQMNEEQKADSIYRWIMQNNTYDYEVAQSNEPVSMSVKQPAYYLEGVLDYGFAVCDGISKTYTLMCAIAGVDCVRVVGTAGTTTKGGHAWNKVKIEGNWYVVDATWGDSKLSISGKEYELGTHEYFLRTDAYMAKTHEENYADMYPSTAAEEYDWFGKMRTYDGGNYSYKLSDGTADGEYYCKVDDIVNFLASDVKFEHKQGKRTLTSEVYAAELVMTENRYQEFSISYLSKFAKKGIASSKVAMVRVGSGRYIVIIKK